RVTDAIIWAPFCRSLMAEALAWAGHTDEAEDLLNQALDLSVQTGGAWFDAELYRRKGQVLLMRPAPDHRSAEECFLQAIAIARNQSAKFWDRRAAMCFARLGQGEGKLAEARAALGPVHAWFTEGHEVPDLKDAAVLLETLGC